MTTDHLAITCDSAGWREALARFDGGDASRTFRRELGIEDAHPVVMSGHQPWLWHPGILAKVAALGAASEACDAAGAWVWVDQDVLDPGEVSYPAVGAKGEVRRTAWRLAPGPGADVPLASAAAWPADGLAPAPTDAHPACRAGGLERVRRALTGAASREGLGAQWAGAMESLCTEEGFPLGASGARAGARSFSATAMARTSLFGEVLARMKADPGRAAETYNAAAERDPGAGIRALRVDEDVELPLWFLEPGRARRPVFASDLESWRDGPALAPRALLMTGLLRAHACELFIHGRGGGRYDRITEDWFSAWLGARLAPVAVVSADVRLPLLDGPVPSAREVAQARGLAHRARHDPALLGDAAGGEAKRAAVAEIARRRRAGENPAPVFAHLHRMLEAARAQAPSRLAAVDAMAGDVARRFAQREVAGARDWPWVLASAGVLEALRLGVRARVAGAVR